MTKYEEFYKRISLFEIATIKQFPKAATLEGAIIL